MSVRSLRHIAAPLTGSILLLSLARGVMAQNSLAAAKDLYASAAYEDALTLLARLKEAGTGAADDGQMIEQYRAFCLLALGRPGEAERAIEAIVASDPLYQPAEFDASPRVRTTFREVRRRMLPGLAQERYAMAKATYDRKEFKAAAAQFKRLLAILDDPDLDRNAPGVADMRTLSRDFAELATAAAAPPPPPAAPEPPAEMLSVARIYSANDLDVAPPVAIRQDLPRWPVTPVSLQSSRRGVIELVIGETGDVEATTLRESMNRVYDQLLLTAAKTWKYRPATKQGRPVKFRKTIQVSLETP